MTYNYLLGHGHVTRGDRWLFQCGSRWAGSGIPSTPITAPATSLGSLCLEMLLEQSHDSKWLRRVVAGLWEVLQFEDRYPQLPKGADRVGTGQRGSPGRQGSSPGKRGCPQTSCLSWVSRGAPVAVLRVSEGFPNARMLGWAGNILLRME